MNFIKLLTILLILVGLSSSCQAINTEGKDVLVLGCENFDSYLPLLKGKNVGLLVNHTSAIDGVHLVDTLIALDVNVTKIFAPEHGFRGNADAGETIKSSTDSKTGIPIISMYGKSKKPSAEALKDLEVVIFDIQDVGVRFYTYISSMHYMMEACAENDVEFIVLDRPNPNGDYFDGPVLKKEFTSFVGMHPIPVVHGLTVGELARMINGEGWLKDKIKVKLKVIEMKNYTHDTFYSLPVKPSPNLPNDISIRLYPSLCFFEATTISVGRGTYMPFQVIGYPNSCMGDFTFTPVSIEGMSKYPPQQDKLCYGKDLRKESLDDRFTLQYFIDFINKCVDKEKLIDKEKWFNLLAGNDTLLKKIKEGWSEEEIKSSWEAELKDYAKVREKYLIYP